MAVLKFHGKIAPWFMTLIQRRTTRFYYRAAGQDSRPESIFTLFSLLFGLRFFLSCLTLLFFFPAKTKTNLGVALIVAQYNQRFCSHFLHFFTALFRKNGITISRFIFFRSLGVFTLYPKRSWTIPNSNYHFYFLLYLSIILFYAFFHFFMLFPFAFSF